MATPTSSDRMPIPAILVLVVVGGVFAWMAFWFVVTLGLGDPGDPGGLVITNRSDEPLIVYVSERLSPFDPSAVRESEIARLQPGSDVRPDVDCGRWIELVARTVDGDEVERSPCYDRPWSIGEPA